MQRVLVVDDEPPIQRALATNLRARGYVVDLAADGRQALDLAARRHPALVILDLGLPGIDGIDVVRRLRGWSSVPILILSARGAEPDKVAALDAGADDYVAKPFSMNELMARVRAALRRGIPDDASPTITTDHFSIDLATKQVTAPGGEPIRVTPIEWQIIELLARNAGKPIPARRLLQAIWGPDYEQQTNYIRIHIAHVRRKLEPTPARPRYFVNEPGIGYRFLPDGGEPTATRGA
jgi:two-component system, OmpR family, KDP operon response regulator KdpE